MKNDQHVRHTLSRRFFAEAVAPSNAWPPFAGTLYLDESTRRAYARDYGEIVHAYPRAILLPGSVDDIVELIRFARRNGLRIAVRGHGHQPFGQAQVRDGVIVDMRSLRAVHSVAHDHVDVDAGADWRTVLTAALGHAGTPPVLPNYLGLTVGGTLSVGGIGVATLRYGPQVDHVRELQVVTGEGEVITCSDREHRNLFEAVLAGQGQCAIITRAVLRLVSARPMLREYVLNYAEPTTLLEDQRVIQDGRFDGAVALILPSPQGWSYSLQAIRQFTPPDLPEDAELLIGLHYIAGSEQRRDVSYLEYADARPPFDPAQSHTDLGLLIPGEAAARFIGSVLPRLTASDLGSAKAMRVFSWNRSLFTRALFRTPEAETCVYVGLLRAETTDRDAVARMLAGNRVLFEENRRLGGTLYAFCALELTRDDWRQHYDQAWRTLLEAKRRYDPDNVFASGPDLFNDRAGTAGSNDWG